MKHSKFVLILFLVVAAGLKAALLVFDRFPFNADEAIVALMARHILLNGERPVFFYGQAYMGSFDAYLVAIGFALFGFEVWVIRAVQTLLYLLVILSSLALRTMLFPPSHGRWYTAALLAIPTVNVTLYTTVSLGGYGEALLIGNLILHCGLKILHALENRASLHRLWFWGLGFFTGLGLWVNGLTAIYTLPVMIGIAYQVFRERGRLNLKNLVLASLLISAGVLVGSLPWWHQASHQGWQALLGELFGSAIAVSHGFGA